MSETLEPRRIPVALGERSYEVAVGDFVPSDTTDQLLEHFSAGSALLLADKRVFSLYGAAVVEKLGARGLYCTVELFEPGEQSKSWQSAERVLEAMNRAKLSRDRPLISLGGGVAGDLGGFCASLYRRGVPHATIATSLLAQVDSAVGGKTAVNLGAAKNSVGTFHQPAFVACPLGALATLPDREYRSGLAEALKMALLCSPSLWKQLTEGAASLVQRDTQTLFPIICECVERKIEYVIGDERDTTGLRAQLNLGHTFGHALEAATGFSELLHGEAVAVGLVVAARISERLGVCEPGVAAQVQQALEALGLDADPRRHRKTPWRQHLDADKKSTQSGLDLVLLVCIGEACVRRFRADDAGKWIEEALSV